MSILKKLSNLFSTPARPDDSAYWITVKCNRCGEIIRTRINLYNDLSADYTESGEPVYYCRKMLMSEGGRCFQRVEVELKFDAKRQLLSRDISGGTFVEG